MEGQLLVIVKESGLEGAKAQVLLDNFSAYFQIACEWETKAKAIVVTDANQVAEMKMARVGRLFLREKRIAIEKTRKSLKEQALREGKAIDGIANILKALIVPIEKHLEKQEKYVEIKEAEEAKRKQEEADKKAEEERIAKEKAEEEERERMRKENERLKEEIKEREQKITEQQIEVVKVEEEKKEQEKGIKKERKDMERAIDEERKRYDRDLITARAEAEEVKKKAEARMVECPFCHRSFVWDK